jgi:sulfite reductase alpha subunit-like flavoprotein
LTRSAAQAADEFLQGCDEALRESVENMERLSRQAQELADRAVKVVVQRQTANESEVAQKLSRIRQRLTAVQGLFNEMSRLRKSLGDAR